MAIIKKCDVCGRLATLNNPIRKATIFFGKNVINGNDAFYQQEVDMCLDCKNELRNITAKFEYEFVQDKRYKKIDASSYTKEGVYTEVVDIDPSVNPKELGYYEYVDEEYILSEDETVDTSKTYYIKSEVIIDNPSELEWYEKVGIDYVLSADVNVDMSKTYYEKIKREDC